MGGSVGEVKCVRAHSGEVLDRLTTTLLTQPVPREVEKGAEREKDKAIL